jgi:predicted Zn-dependent protease
MKRNVLLLALALFVPFLLIANDYEEAWRALHQNDRKKAKELLKQAMGNPQTAVDAYLTWIFLQEFEGKDNEITDFADKLYGKVDNPNPYLFALWFNQAVLGDYGKKTKSHHLAILDRILKDPAINGSMKASAHYVKAMHHLFGNDFDKAAQEYAKVGGVENWQFVGPFDNLSGSGFQKSFGPLEHPEATATFTSSGNAQIKWFTPPYQNKDGWTFPYSHFRYNTAILYGQTFVNAPSDMKVLLNAGASGTLKVWVNDELVITESKERVTELDCFKQYVQLKKGYNRLLVQLGYVDNSFPNYIIRFTDDQFNPIPNLGFSNQNQSYTKVTNQSTATPVKHFAEAYFENKIKAEPNNYIHYLLLAQTYLRNKKVAEARKIVETALQKDPENSLIRLLRIQCLLKEENRTIAMQEIERIKEKDPLCLLTYELNIQRLMNEEKYDEALKELDNEEKLFGKSANSIETRIRLYGEQKKMEDLIKLIREAYEKYPDEPDFAQYMFSLNKNAMKNAKGALKVYEDFKKKNYNYNIYKTLCEEYIEQGMGEKGLQILQQLYKTFPYDPDLAVDVARYYFNKQDYKKALEYCNQSLQLAPYVSSFWDNLGVIYEQLGQKKEAIEAYNKALYYDRNRFSARTKLRTLQNKPDIYKAFPETDAYELIKKANVSKHQEHNYYYLLDEKYTIIYSEGATEEYVNMVIKINNEKGIDAWKETSIGYNDNNQNLLIEKAEVVKPNGSKVPAEKNGNDIVYAGLEAGDAIILKYKIQHFSWGRLGKEHWDKFVFNAFVPTEQTRYCLLASKNIKFNHKVINSTIQPNVSDFEDFKLYTWQLSNLAAFKEEPYMPPLQDVGAVLHISTLTSWSEIADWYRDLVTEAMENDYEVKEKFNELFPAGKKYSNREKATLIYDYITHNIRYSSVSFRQSAFTPQKPSKTITTRLGDCKDLSTLYVALAGMAGLKANLMLVDTRDRGAKNMVFPSVEFNHCIVKLYIDDKEYYIELTDNNLPFGSMPNNLNNALSLVIPGAGEKATNADLQPIKSLYRTRDKIARTINVSVDETDMKIKVVAKRMGALTSSTRDQYLSLSADKQREEMEKTISSSYKGNVKVQEISFKGLDELVDSVIYNYTYSVKNEVVEVGEMKMLKIPFTDVIATVDNFSLDKRQFPVEYWSYENTDEYETVIHLEAPKGKQFIEIPKDQSFTFRNNRYSIQFIKKQPDKLTIVRKASLQRDNISPAEYSEFLNFFNQIVKVESKYVVFK